jgi:uncharacterized protein
MSESNRRFELTVLPGFFAIVRLAADAPLPPWATAGGFFSVTRTGDELSVICLANQVPSGLRAEAGWRALKVHGPFAFSEIGVLAALATPLAHAKVSVLATSTFDTDYLLVSDKKLDAATAALRATGHRVVDDNAIR